MITSTLRALALIAADTLEHQPLGVLRSASDDLRYYAFNGTSRYPAPRRDLVRLGPIALTRPLHRTVGRALRDLRDAWWSATTEVSVREAFERGARREDVDA